MTIPLPSLVIIATVRYVPMTLKVESRDEFGRPVLLGALYRAEVNAGDDFITVLIPESLTEPDGKARA